MATECGFASGVTEPSRAVAERLAGLRLSGRPAHIHYGLLRKAVVRLDDGSFVKLALHPISTALLRNEAAAYAAAAPRRYVRPKFRLLADCGEWAAAWLSPGDGCAMSRWSSMRRRPGPFEDVPGRPTNVADYLGRLETTPRFEPWKKAIIDRWGDAPLTLTPSHGDFVHWNMLARNGAPTLLDYEYYSPERARSFDRCLWTLVPLLRRPAGRAMARLAGGLWASHLGVGQAELLAVLYEHASAMTVELDMPDFAALSGNDAVRRRNLLLDAYETLMRRLLG